jgi:hypothetical protein
MTLRVMIILSAPNKKQPQKKSRLSQIAVRFRFPIMNMLKEQGNHIFR